MSENKGFNCTSLKYNVLKNMMVGKAVIKDALAHWEQFGFLDKINDEVKKEQTAVAFDNITHDLLTENSRVVEIRNRYNFNCYPPEGFVNKYPMFNFETIVYPLIRRIICGNMNGKTGTDNFDYDKFIELLEKYSFLAVNFDFIDEEDKDKFDVEAEFVCILAGIIEDIFNNK